jgi:adenylate kinase family enzyme
MHSLDLIVVAGAPGTGKSTVCAELRSRLGSPYIEFSTLRQPHLDQLWRNASDTEHEMSFQNLAFMLGNYWRHGYRDVILTDLQDDRLARIPTDLAPRTFGIFTLVVDREDELRARISSRREGFVNVQAALSWNRAVRARAALPRELKLTIDGLPAEQIANTILQARSDPALQADDHLGRCAPS